MKTADRHVRGKCGIRCTRTVTTAPARPLKLQHEACMKKKTKALKKKAEPTLPSTATPVTKEDLSNDCKEQRDGPVDYAAECVRLREQLEHVLIDHQRQSEEIVALRALAKTLKSEVEAIHDSRQQQPNPHQEPLELQGQRGSHEFFKLDLQIEGLRIENEELTKQLQKINHESQGIQTMLARELPRYKLHAVQARAELESVVSQLREEQMHSDKLRAQLIRLKARSEQPIQVAPPRLNSGSCSSVDLASDKWASMASVRSKPDAWDNAIDLQADAGRGDPGKVCGNKENIRGNGNSDRSSVRPQPKHSTRALASGSPDSTVWILPGDISIADLVGPLTQLEGQLTQLHSALDEMKGTAKSES